VMSSSNLLLACVKTCRTSDGFLYSLSIVAQQCIFCLVTIVTGNYHFPPESYSEGNIQIWGRDPRTQHVFLMDGLP